MRVGLLSLAQRTRETEDESAMREIGLLEHVNARNRFVSAVNAERNNSYKILYV